MLTPVPVVEKIQEQLSFYDALKEVAKGNRITRLSWDKNEDSYCLMIDSFLSIHLHGKFSQWIVNDGDMEGLDWIVLGEVK